MRVGVIDVGSNTVRLLVATSKGSTVRPVREERTALGLARDIERTGGISAANLGRAAALARRYAKDAAKTGATRIDVLVTAPARQAANGEDLVAAIAETTGLPVRALSPDEEGRLAFAGVVATFPAPPASLAVCDVGGGSTQLVFGTGVGGPVWFRSLDLGSLRLAQRFLAHDPPEKGELEALRADVESSFSGLAPPLPRCAVAAGGTARALRRLVGRTLGPKQLAKAATELSACRTATIAKEYRLPLWRAETLLAGVIVLTEAQRRLNVPLVVARAGLREGAVLESLAAAQAA
jgi:exopolyphosphatase / guanosine-5'-triphosphate,3'-diphosphate pyrophosphatase